MADLYDRNNCEAIYEASHINQMFLHNGMHTGTPGWFGFNLAHIHPGTSRSFTRESEGSGANLSNFLEINWSMDLGYQRI